MIKEQFTYRGNRYEYEMQKTRRKRLAIMIKETGEIVVRIPNQVPYEEGRTFVMQKRDWIVRQQEKILKELQKKQETDTSYRKCHTFLPGDVFYYRGNPCSLVVRESAQAIRARIEKCKDQLVIAGPVLNVEQRKYIIEEWFKRVAKLRFQERCSYYAEKLNVHYQTIRVKNQKSRWGSCSSKKNLNFNWKLIMAPDKVLDYVVIHELSHLREMNHSAAFYALVASIMPDYQEQEGWLKEHQDTILYWE